MDPLVSTSKLSNSCEMELSGKFSSPATILYPATYQVYTVAAAENRVYSTILATDVFTITTQGKLYTTAIRYPHQLL